MEIPNETRSNCCTNRIKSRNAINRLYIALTNDKPNLKQRIINKRPNYFIKYLLKLMIDIRTVIRQ